MSAPPEKEPQAHKDTSLHIFDAEGVSIAYRAIGDADAPLVIWGHGWGQDHRGLMPLAESLRGKYKHIVIDFPGFGQSPVPFTRIEESWGSLEYAHAIARLITHLGGSKENPIFWIGHSFGCRVATQLACHYPDLVRGMVYIGGAGLKRGRSLIKRVWLRLKVAFYKLCKLLLKWPLLAKSLKNKQFGSSDYQRAGVMRGTLIKVVNEDLAYEAMQIACPVLLIYGENDTETPPETGRRFQSLIKSSEMISLPAQDHYTVLSDGRHQVAPIIKNFLTKN